MVLVLLCATQVVGQKAMSRSLGSVKTESAENVKYGAFGEVLETKTTDETEKTEKVNIPVSKAVYFHKAKVITAETGYFIELLTSKEELGIENGIFQEFGNLMVMKDKGYAYLIGSFTTEETAKKFLEHTILARYPEAKIVLLKNGIRK